MGTFMKNALASLLALVKRVRKPQEPKAPPTSRSVRQVSWNGQEKGLIMAEKWIQKAIKKPGALRKESEAKPGKPIPAKN